MRRNDPATQDRAARRTLSLLEFATDLDNPLKVRTLMGYGRQQFYEFHRSGILFIKPIGQAGPAFSNGKNRLFNNIY